MRLIAFFHAAGKFLDHLTVILQRWCRCDFFHTSLSTKKGSSLCGDFFNSVKDIFGYLAIHCSDGSFQNHLFRDDIWSFAGIKLSNGKCGWLGGGNFSCNDFLKRQINMGRNIDGVNSGFWHCAMAAGTFYMNLKYGTSRHADAGTTHNRSGWNAGNNMKCNACIYMGIFQNTGIKHCLCACEPLFVRLKYQFYSSYQILLVLF